MESGLAGLCAFCYLSVAAAASTLLRRLLFCCRTVGLTAACWKPINNSREWRSTLAPCHGFRASSAAAHTRKAIKIGRQCSRYRERFVMLGFFIIFSNITVGLLSVQYRLASYLILWFNANPRETDARL